MYVSSHSKLLHSGKIHNMPAEDLNADDAVEEKIHDSRHHGSVFSGYTVMAKSLLGSGMLSIAFACAKSGLIIGVILLVFAAVLTWISLHVISKLCLEFPSTDITFYSITERVLPRFRWLLDVAVIIDCLGSAICFVQVMGGLLGDAFEHMFGLGPFSKWSLDVLVQCCLVLLLYPLCLMKEITNTKIANIIGLTCLVYVTVLAMVYTDVSKFASTMLYPKNGSIWAVVSAFPVMIFAFSCQQNLLSVASEMKGATIGKLSIVTVGAVGTGLLLYVPIMILPFVTFGYPGPKAQTIFDLLPQTTPVKIGMICASLAVSISFVLVIHPIRRSVMSLVYGSEFPTGSIEFRARIIIVTVIVAVSVGVAIAAGKSLDTTLAFTGLLGATTCGFTMPCVLFLVHFGFSAKSAISVTVAVMLVFCILLYPLGITAIIIGLKGVA